MHWQMTSVVSPLRVELTDEGVIKMEKSRCRHPLLLRIIAGDSQGCSTLTHLETDAKGYMHLISLPLSKSLLTSKELKIRRLAKFSTAKEAKSVLRRM